MKITAIHYDKIVSIEVGHEDVTFDEFMEDMIRPLIVAIGYSPSLYDELVGEIIFDETTEE